MWTQAGVKDGWASHGVNQLSLLLRCKLKQQVDTNINKVQAGGCSDLAATFLYKKQVSPASYSSKAVLQTRSLSDFLLSSRYKQHPIAWNSRGMSNSYWHVLILPKAPGAAVSCTPSDTSGPLLAQKCLLPKEVQDLSTTVIGATCFPWAIFSLTLFIYKVKKKGCLLSSPGKCCSQVVHRWIAKPNNYSFNRGTQCSTLSYSLDAWGITLFQWYQH